jgi:hypothetical protein
MAYEATKVFTIRNMETQFTNTNTHIYAQTYYSSMQCHRKLNLIRLGAKNEGRRPEEIFKFGVSEMPFPGLWWKFWQNSDGQKTAF